MSRPTVFLFDIDGTLLLTGGAGRRAIDGAFDRIIGRADACSGFSFGGMTDRAIARAGLLAAGVDPTKERIDDILDTYLALLATEVASSADYKILPGVAAAIALVQRRARSAIGLGTGNIRSGAQIKLLRGDLWRHFDFGGFGCDEEDRTALLAVGAARGAARLGVPIAECRVVVIGDTVRDVAAAKGIGADCLAVGTGGIALEILQQAGAHHVYPTLESPQALAMLWS
jgi:phosphoglycolate phosphatase-like HAD superfamily hydrolase